MELENGVIWAVWGPLQELAQVKLPVKVSFQIAHLAAKLRDPYGIVEGQRLGIVQKHGTKSEDGRTINIEQGSEAHIAATTEIQELFGLCQTVPLDEKWQKIKLPEQVDSKPLEIESRILLPLLDFVELG